MDKDSNKKKKFTIAGLFDNKPFVIVFSLILAIICWAIVSFVISDEFTMTIRDVPITFSNSALENQGLSVVEKSDETVNVRVTGKRSDVAKLGPEDILVTPNYANVTGSGTYEVSLSASRANTNVNFTIVSTSLSSVTLRIDFPYTKEFAIVPEIAPPQVPEGYVVGQITTSPSKINVTGPRAEVEEVDSAVVRYTFTGEITSTPPLTCDVVLLDASGKEINNENLVLDNEQVEVSVPVLKKATLELRVEFINQPEGFDLGTLEYTMSQESIEIAAHEQTVENLTPRTVGYIDMTTLELGQTFEFDVQLPNGYLNIDNVSTVTVTFPSQGFTSRRLNVTTIRLENVPANYNITIETSTINNVAVIGPEDEINALLPTSVVAIADISLLNIQSGEYRVPVKFVIPTSSSVWVAGSYEILISVTVS